MGVTATARAVYAATRSIVSALEANIRDTLTAYCMRQNYLFSIRTKSAESLSEKLETGRYQRLSQLDDLLACTIVVPSPSHEPRVIDFLDTQYGRQELRQRNRTQKAPDVFRFDATRYIARFKPQPGVEYPSGVDQLLFEVQISTVFEYAWSVATHDLVYKADDVDWRKLRLAAQLKAAVEQMELLIAAFEGATALVPTSSYPSTEARQLVVSTFKRLVADGLISAELEPQSWSRFSENVLALVQSYTRDQRAVPEAINQLLEFAEGQLRQPDRTPSPKSGSMFQLVLGWINDYRLPYANLDRFVVLPSVELRDLYGIKDLPRPLLLDWEAIGIEPPSQ